MPPPTADICVVIAAFDAEATVGRAVRSALAEPEAAEVLVIDDGSRDDTAAVARWSDDGSGRLKVFTQPTRGRGPAAARNRALAESRAAWICPLDSDDYFLPGRLAALRREADGFDLVADDLLQVDDGAPVGSAKPLIGLDLPLTLGFAEFVRANISRPNRPRGELGFLKPLIRRGFLEANGLAYDESLRLGEDFVLYATALARGARFRLVEACGYVAVARVDSLSGRHDGADLLRLLEADRRLLATLDHPAEISALRAHARHLAGKVKLREFLDARRAGGIAAALGVLASSPGVAPYVFGRAVLDKLNALRRASLAASPETGGRGRAQG
jgi:succinoglycan biosynthesis protein ExoU